MTTDTNLHEILERVIRLESRMVQLGDFVGANLRAKQRIDIVMREGRPMVAIDALDVSLSRIRKELQAKVPQAELRRLSPIDVMHEGHLVMSLYL